VLRGTAPPRNARLMLAETLSAMVETDLNVQATASRLHVHPNTVRYRVRRFEEGTGLRLTCDRDACLLWWPSNTAA